jgi:hypothetical protein
MVEWVVFCIYKYTGYAVPVHGRDTFRRELRPGRVDLELLGSDAELSPASGMPERMGAPSGRLSSQHSRCHQGRR